MKTRQKTIPCAIFRGGTSRGAYFHLDDLPEDETARDNVLLTVIGGPDALQIDGIGGGHPLTNKVAVVSRSERDDADIDYLFLQVMPQESKVSVVQNCGNILAGIGPFAIESGLVNAVSPHTKICVHMVNSGSSCELTIETPDRIVNYTGDTSIDGVPGTASPIVCNFLDIAGSNCGALLPTGNVIDTVDDVQVTCIDNGMPVVLLRASDFAVSGYESPEELDASKALQAKIESLRLRLGPMMNLGDVSDKTVPKVCLIAAPRDGGCVSTRTFIPHVCHRSVGVLGAVSVATACLLPGAVTDGVATVPPGPEKSMVVEHPSGSIAVRLVVSQNRSNDSSGNISIETAGVIRTARSLFRGEVYIPQERSATSGRRA